MNTRSALLTALLALTLAGCATTRSEAAAAEAQATPGEPAVTTNPLNQTPAEAANKLRFARETAPDDHYVCEKEKPTGSHLAEVKCKTVRQYDEERERTRHVVDQVTKLRQRPLGFE